MNKISLSRLVLAGVISLTALRASEAPAPAPAPTPAATPSAPVSPAQAASSANLTSQVNAVVAKINTKLQKGLRSESDFAPEMAEFDAIITAHKSEKTDAVATAEYERDLLYIQVFNEPEKFLDACKQIVTDYAGTNVAKQVAGILPKLEPQVQAMASSAKAKKDLVVGKPFPEFAVASGPVKDLDGKELSIAQYRGKIVLIDFWATWCGPCMGEMPNVVAAYDKYHSKGFEIIGVSLDHEEDRAKLPLFLADHKMPWRQFFDGKYWSTELAVKYGIQSIPASYLLDGTGKIIAIDPRGPALEPAIEAALAAASANKT